MSEWWIGNEKIGNEGKKISGTDSNNKIQPQHS